MCNEGYIIWNEPSLVLDVEDIRDKLMELLLLFSTTIGKNLLGMT